MELHPVHDPVNFGTEDGLGCLPESNIPQLTANQLEIAQKLTLVLAPIEEITQAISKQTATLSMVIPFVRVLLRSWEKEDDDRGIQTMKEQMIHSLNSRFAGIEDNHLLSVATLTDSRFKDRFFGSNIVKASAKHMLQMLQERNHQVKIQWTMWMEPRHLHQKGIKIIHFWRYFQIS